MNFVSSCKLYEKSKENMVKMAYLIKISCLIKTWPAFSNKQTSERYGFKLAAGEVVLL